MFGDYVSRNKCLNLISFRLEGSIVLLFPSSGKLTSIKSSKINERFRKIINNEIFRENSTALLAIHKSSLSSIFSMKVLKLVLRNLLLSFQYFKT